MNENLNVFWGRLGNFFRTETVAGTSIKVGEVTLVPIIEISLAMSAGGGFGKIVPNSILVVKGEEVSLLPLKNKGSLEKIMEMIPDLVSKVKGEKEE